MNPKIIQKTFKTQNRKIATSIRISGFEIFNPELDDDSEDDNGNDDSSSDHSSSDSSQESVVSAPNKSENEKSEMMSRPSVSIDDPSQLG